MENAMTNELTTFTTPDALGGLAIRVSQIEGSPWFNAPDVCRALGMAAHKGGFTHHLEKLNPQDRRATPMSNMGGTPVSVISEAGLYKLILRSDKPEAKAFQTWVTRDVLPAIRKDGSYVMGEEKVATGEMTEDELVLKALTSLQAKVERYRLENAKLTAENAVMVPKALIVDVHVASRLHDTISRFARTLVGVNSTSIKRDLMGHGYLWRTGKGSYRVRSQYRDSVFVEKMDPAYGSFEVYVTEAGRAVIASLYQAGKLTMKKAA